MQRFLCTALLILLSCVPLAAADLVWLQYGPHGVMARTIVSGECPRIHFDGGLPHRMHTRVGPSPDQANTVCEMSVPAGTRSARIGEVALPIAKTLVTPKRIAIVGDTGCRVRENQIQDCSDPAAWPFSRIASAVAKWDPDLIIHVGDYYYREYECSSPSSCQGPSYEWERWDEDFFKPARQLLVAAPWIFIRGNHEDCKRAAEGWFRYLDGGTYSYENPKQCKSNLETRPPYTVTAGDFQFFVVDSSSVKDSEVDPDQLTTFTRQFSLLKKTAPTAWLLLHHPVWGVVEPKNTLISTNVTLQQAWSANPAPPAIDATISGHVHLFEALGFADSGAPQFVVGMSGTMLDSPLSTDPSTMTLGGRAVASFRSADSYGFLGATPAAGAWSFAFTDPSGMTLFQCAARDGSFSCQ